MNITLLNIKQALSDGRFRDSLPYELREDILKYLNNPNCQCNLPFYRKLIKDYKEYILKYFPNGEILEQEDEIKEENNWTVINCSIHDLEKELKKLPPGRKNIAIARYEDQLTCVIDQL